MTQNTNAFWCFFDYVVGGDMSIDEAFLKWEKFNKQRETLLTFLEVEKHPDVDLVRDSLEFSSDNMSKKRLQSVDEILINLHCEYSINTSGLGYDDICELIDDIMFCTLSALDLFSPDGE